MAGTRAVLVFLPALASAVTPVRLAALRMDYPDLPEECPAFLQQNSGAFQIPSGEDLMSFLGGAKLPGMPSKGSGMTRKEPTKSMARKDAISSMANLIAGGDKGDGVKQEYKPEICKPPQGLKYCSGVNWDVPFYGWDKWAQYVEACAEHYIEYYYKEDNTTAACVEEAKKAMCAAYFPKCGGTDEDGNVVLLKPCKSHCYTWKEDLKCPGTEMITCKAESAITISFAQKGDCTEYLGGAGAVGQEKVTPEMIGPGDKMPFMSSKAAGAAGAKGVMAMKTNEADKAADMARMDADLAQKQAQVSSDRAKSQALEAVRSQKEAENAALKARQALEQAVSGKKPRVNPKMLSEAQTLVSTPPLSQQEQAALETEMMRHELATDGGSSATPKNMQARAAQ